MTGRAGGEVIVVGSANVDLTIRVERLPAAGETVTGGTFNRQNGGKGANQAIAAARYGAATRFVGAVGDDPLADEIVDGLRAAGVVTSGVARLPGRPTGVAVIVVDARGENQIAVASGANAALSASLVDAALASVEPPAGSICLVGFEIGDEAILAAARWARGYDLRLIVNPAPARRLPDGLVQLAPILTPNRGEATILTGLVEPGPAAAALRTQTGAAVIVTLGAGGAIVVDGDGETALSAILVSPVDATGAGDAFNGILAAELAAGAEVRAAGRRAAAGASLATRSRGAQAGMPTWDEVRVALEH